MNINNNKPELVLGTAEFNPEGYAGKPCPYKKEIIRILNLAWEAGIRRLDTAEAYHCDEILNTFGGGFTQIKKNRNRASAAFYHYKQDEKALPSFKASVYTLEQFRATLQEVIIPFNINNTEFTDYFDSRIPIYIRSVFDRGRLLEQGYTVKDCLGFVKRQPVNGVIVGVSKEKELEEILKAWNI